MMDEAVVEAGREQLSLRLLVVMFGVNEKRASYYQM